MSETQTKTIFETIIDVIKNKEIVNDKYISESQICRNICNSINNGKNQKGARTNKYIKSDNDNYHSHSYYHLNESGVIESIKNKSNWKKQNRKLDINPDIYIENQKEIFLFEVKVQFDYFYPWAYCLTGNDRDLETIYLSEHSVGTACGAEPKIFTHPIYKQGNKNYYTDANEGKIWIDIIRLIEAKKRLDNINKTARVRIFQLFFIDHNIFGNVENNLPKIYEIFNNKEFQYIICQGKETLDIWEKPGGECEFKFFKKEEGNVHSISIFNEKIVPLSSLNECDLLVNFTRHPILLEIL